MAKHHPPMWNGVDIVTSLTPDAIWAAAAEALVGVNGKFTLSADADLLRAYDIKGSDTLWASSPELTFDIQVSDAHDGRRAVRTHVIRTMLKDSSIPFGPKKMLGQRSYMRFAENFGERVRAQDPTATVASRAGAMPAGFDLGSLSARVLPPSAAA